MLKLAEYFADAGTLWALRKEAKAIFCELKISARLVELNNKWNG